MRLPLALISVLATGVTADVHMSDRFTVSDTCHNNNVDQLITDTIDMAKTAATALGDLADANVMLRSRFRTEATNLLLWKAQVAWGIKIPDSMFQSTLAQDDIDRLNKARYNYNMIVNILESGSGISPTDNFFYCDSANLAWIDSTHRAAEIFYPGSVPQTSQMDMGLYLRAIAAKNLDGSPMQGVWNDTEHVDSHQHKVWTIDEYPTGRTICGNDAHQSEAITYGKSYPKQMFLCPKSWDPTYYQPSLRHQRGAQGQVEYDKVRSLPGVFLHEMMHWLDLRQDDRIIDYSPMHPTNGGLTTGYGLLGVYAIAGNELDEGPNLNTNLTKTLINADTYHVFATMAYLNEAAFVP